MAKDFFDIDCPVIEIDGPYFYRQQERFIARGLVYQPHIKAGVPRAGVAYPDALDDGRYSELLLDTAVFKEMNVNALWVNSLRPDVSHKESMRLLAKLGIYVIFRIERFSMSTTIRGEKPRERYTEELLRGYTEMIDSVACYPNTLGVCIASQVISHKDDGNTGKLEDIRHLYGSVVRDLKRYMRYKNHDTGQRIIPLCVNEGQWSAQVGSTFDYVAGLDVKGRPAGGRVDFYTFVHYDVLRDLSNAQNWKPFPPWDPHAHTGDSSEPRLVVPEDTPSWTDQLPMQQFTAVSDPIPVLISEYGTMSQAPREFDEVRQLYGNCLDSPLLNTLSGGFVYEYSEGSSRYGLVGRGAEGRMLMLMDFWNFRGAMRDALGLPAQRAADVTSLGADLQHALGEGSGGG